ncbi:Flagella accessory C family protein [Natronococcus amylolyticus DSM 10524]|uniref:Flagella accessory C family protein n=1 Tax=Natronococcus amylolyticus DSM 10524 TaxID=1227497 RepID=L9XII9_9EURY|nr:FlaD/FlaE family flagellar protein [Natronococcus amylolyticus]ELY61432.1 Flagella accessory C family protein [Natronococcus amylolyticus DSM 10524]
MAAGLNWLLRLLGHGKSDADPEPAGLEPADWEADPELEEFDESVAEEDGDLEDADDEATLEDDAEDEHDEFAALEPAPLDDPDDDSGGIDLSWASSFSNSSDEAGADGGEDGPDEEAVDELYYRTEGLEESLEDTEMRLDAIQDSQEQVVSQVDELNDRVRRLLGLYDQVTDDINPFTGEGEADNGFEVFGDEHADTEGETVSFDDLKGEVEIEPVDEIGDDEPEPEPTAEPQLERRSPDEPALRELPDTYATDVVVFEWLADLLEAGGPRATLEALSYYVEVGWIDEEVRVHLESVLAGPGLETAAPAGAAELTADDHADSYAYMMQLREIREIRRTVEP